MTAVSAPAPASNGDNRISQHLNGTAHSEPEGQVIDLPPASILPPLLNRERPLEVIQKMAQSLKLHGQLQPCRVAKEGGGYRTIAGETRRQAALYLGWKTIQCVVVEGLTPLEQKLQTFEENEQRAGWTPIERAEFYQGLIAENNWTLTELATRLRKHPPEITKTLAISRNLIEPMKALVAAGKLPASNAYLWSRLPAEVQAKHVDQASELKREFIEGLLGEQKSKEKKPKPAPPVVVRIGGMIVSIPADAPVEIGKANAERLLESFRKAERHNLPVSAIPSLI